jgi:3-isopropylmalate dehydratase
MSSNGLKMKYNLYLLLAMIILIMLVSSSALQHQQRTFRQPRSYSSYSSPVMMSAIDGPKTMFDKIWNLHLVDDSGGNNLIYIDRHLVHEVTSPQAFEGLRISGRAVRRPDCTLVTVDHNVPTSDRSNFKNVETFIKETESKTQVLALEENVRDFGLTYFGMDDARQGIVHIIGPEQGFTLPG